MRKSPDQDVGEWRKDGEKKRLKQLIERKIGACRAEMRELVERYEREGGRLDELEPPPCIN